MGGGAPRQMRDGKHIHPSWPGFPRPSTTSLPSEGKNVDGRDIGERSADVLQTALPGHDGGGKKRAIRVATVLAIATVFVSVAFTTWVVSLGPLPLAQAREVSTTIVDRNGKLLRAYAMADGRWRLPVDARTVVDPGYLKLLLAYEDRRFYSHGGVDPLALARAAFQLVSRGHIV